LEAVGARQFPSRLEARVIGARQQLAGLQDAVEVGESDDAIGRRPAHKMLGRNWLGCSRPAAATNSASALTVSRWKLATRTDLSPTTMPRWRRRSCHPGRAMAGVTLLGLNAADRKHEAAPGVAPA
jgi:hypothetical protein